MKSHKYYARVGQPLNYRYFYSREAYEAFQNHSNSAANRMKNTSNAARQRFDKVKRKVRYRLHDIKIGAAAPEQVEKHKKRLGLTSRTRSIQGTGKKIKTEATERARINEQMHSDPRSARNVSGKAKKVNSQAQREKLMKAVAGMGKHSLSGQVPDQVSAVDYIFGGKSAKSYRDAKKALRRSNMALKKQQKAANALRKKIEKIQSKGHLSYHDKEKLAKYKEQYTAASNAVRTSSKDSIKLQNDYTRSLYMYEATTMMGAIRKKTRAGSVKGKAFISRYKNKLLSAIHTPTIKLNR